MSGRRELTRNLAKREEYKNNLVEAFNAICEYLSYVYHRSDRVENKLECIARINPYSEKCKRAFQTLKLDYNWPEQELTEIDINSIIVVNEQESDTEHQPSISTDQQDIASSTGFSEEFIDAEQNDSRIDQIIQNLSNIDVSDVDESVKGIPTVTEDSTNNNQDIQNQTIEINIVTMVQTQQEFFGMAGKVLNYKYDGDLKFIKSKIIGRARESSAPETIEKVEEITNALKEKIKADSSSVVEGRLTALRLVKGNFTEFAEEAEKLADSFRRSLISEGFTKTKSDELTIKKTKELCRRIANNDAIKSIVATTVCNTPAEVIATLIRTQWYRYANNVYFTHVQTG